MFLDIWLKPGVCVSSASESVSNSVAVLPWSLCRPLSRLHHVPFWENLFLSFELTSTLMDTSASGVLILQVPERQSPSPWKHKAKPVSKRFSARCVIARRDLGTDDGRGRRLRALLDIPTGTRRSWTHTAPCKTRQRINFLEPDISLQPAGGQDETIAGEWLAVGVLRKPPSRIATSPPSLDNSSHFTGPAGPLSLSMQPVHRGALDFHCFGTVGHFEV